MVCTVHVYVAISRELFSCPQIQRLQCKSGYCTIIMIYINNGLCCYVEEAHGAFKMLKRHEKTSDIIVFVKVG